MAEIVRLSEHPGRVEEVRGLPRRYLLLPDVWELLGSLPPELPAVFADELEQLPGFGIGTLIARALLEEARSLGYRSYPLPMVFMGRALQPERMP